MKKFLILLTLIFIGNFASADIMYIESNINQNNFLEKTGKDTEKVITVARKIIHENDLKRAPIFLDKNLKREEIFLP